jgi:hypothetical protein
MFFMVPEEDEPLAQSLAGDQAEGWLEGWLEVTRGQEKFKVWVWAPSELASELAANILSLEPDDISDEDMTDAFKEMINMVVGRLLTVTDKNSEWRMGLPQGRVMAHGTVGEAIQQAQWLAAYDIEEKPLLTGCWSQ